MATSPSPTAAPSADPSTTAALSLNPAATGTHLALSPSPSTSPPLRRSRHFPLLSQLVNNASVTNYYGGLTFNGTTVSLNVFSIDAATLASATGITFTMPTGGCALIHHRRGCALPSVGFQLQRRRLPLELLRRQQHRGFLLRLHPRAPPPSSTSPPAVSTAPSSPKTSQVAAEIHNYAFDHTITTTTTGGGSQVASVPLPLAAYEGALLLLALPIAKRVKRKLAP